MSLLKYGSEVKELQEKLKSSLYSYSHCKTKQAKKKAYESLMKIDAKLDLLKNK